MTTGHLVLSFLGIGGIDTLFCTSASRVRSDRRFVQEISNHHIAFLPKFRNRGISLACYLVTILLLGVLGYFE
jgi:hypothetical protein